MGRAMRAAVASHTWHLTLCSVRYECADLGVAHEADKVSAQLGLVLPGTKGHGQEVVRYFACEESQANESVHKATRWSSIILTFRLSRT